MKVLYAIMAFALMPGSAQAWDVYHTCAGNESWYYGSYNSVCRTSVIPDRPRDRAREAAEENARNEQIAKWEAFCKPVRTTDDLGVVRLRYSRPGCEFGRTE
jgi:hypothetical protein